MGSNLAAKLERMLACPGCGSDDLSRDDAGLTCRACGAAYDRHAGAPVLIRHGSPVLEWYRPVAPAPTPDRVKGGRRPGRGHGLRRFANWIKPPDRVWTKRSRRTIERVLADRNPDAAERTAVLIGAGIEPVYKQILSPYRELIRVGLSHSGRVDVYCDACDLPIAEGRLDLVLSSSVLEHIHDPERAVGEMHRVLKHDGWVYAEIPFMRCYHMEPIDYQRYTIAGIEALFARHGFALIEKGICSGPFTALALLCTDFCRSMLPPRRSWSIVLVALLAAALHPAKFLDRLVENRSGAAVCAANFYYLGRKQR